MNFKMQYSEEKGALCINILHTLEADDVHEIVPLIETELEGKSNRHLLFDMSGTPSDSVSKEARQAFRENADLTNYDKVAIVGASPGARMIAKVALTIAGVSKISRFFKTEDEALYWLKGDCK